MKLFSILAAAVAVTASLASAQTTRVGTFHKPSVVVAFYRSPQWADIDKAKLAELDVARKAKDATKVQELEAWGKTNQELAHRQLAGEAPIANIMEALAPGLAEIARRADVKRIALDLPVADPSIQAIDVTDLILEYLKADARTLAIVRDLQKRQKPAAGR